MSLTSQLSEERVVAGCTLDVAAIALCRIRVARVARFSPAQVVTHLPYLAALLPPPTFLWTFGCVHHHGRGLFHKPKADNTTEVPRAVQRGTAKAPADLHS